MDQVCGLQIELSRFLAQNLRKSSHICLSLWKLDDLLDTFIELTLNVDAGACLSFDFGFHLYGVWKARA